MEHRFPVLERPFPVLEHPFSIFEHPFPVLEHPFSVLERTQPQKPDFFLKLFSAFCPGTSRDRGICPGIFAPALVPGQRDTGTRKFLCPGTKGQRDVLSRGNASSCPWASRIIYCVKLQILNNQISRGHRELLD